MFRSPASVIAGQIERCTRRCEESGESRCCGEVLRRKQPPGVILLFERPVTEAQHDSTRGLGRLECRIVRRFTKGRDINLTGSLTIGY